MKFLSLCSGIEAASVAWHPLGFECIGVAEIEAFPSAVLAHHYPGITNFGDISRFEEWPEEMFADIDIIVGGPPCQSFSIAGLRKGLNDDRGNLTLTYVRIIDHADRVRLRHGKQPVICVYENVPGLLSDKTNAFGSFLGGLAGEDVQLEPSGKRWTDAGCVFGPQRAIAWRIQDAQYHQLAQRRRRVFVVASARDGFDPAAVLLEFEGVRRDTPPRREAGKAASGGATGRAGERSHWDGVEHPHPTLNQSAKASGGVGASNQELFSQRGAYLVGDVTTARMVAFGEYADDGTASTLKSRDYKDATDLITHSLRGEGFDASEDGTGRGTPLVPVHAHGFYQNQGSHGSGNNDQLSPTLKAADSNNLAAAAIAFSYKDSGNDAAVNLSPTLRSLGAYDANGGGQMAVAFAFHENQRAEVTINDTAGSLKVGGGKPGQGYPAVAVSLRGRDGGGTAELGDEVQNCLRASQGGGDKPHVLAAVSAAAFKYTMGSKAHGIGYAEEQAPTLDTKADSNAVLTPAMAVRRLTPVECERLQGFPDGYTMIPWKKREAADCPDGPRYKALGNSMAVPVMRWIGQRIARHLRGEI